MPGHPNTPGYSTDEDKKEKVQNRLRRIEGQVRGLQRMVDEDTYCIDVLTQVASVTKALQGVGMSLLDDHIRHCVREAAGGTGGQPGHGSGGESTVGSGPDPFADKVEEVMSAVARMLRT